MSRFSKSQFIRGLQCHKSLWLYRNRYDLRTEPDDSQQAIFDTGISVGILAQELFPGGQEIVYASEKIDENVRITKELIDSGIETIYEASFIYDNILIMVDILHKGKDSWEMYEVKSSTSVSKKGQLKAQYRQDVSVQYYVLNGRGLDVSKVFMVFINNKYERDGELDVRQLFNIEDVTSTAIEHQTSVIEDLAKLGNMLDCEEPQIDIGPQCSEPYPCDFKEHCWQHIPQNSIFNIYRLNAKQKFALYHEGVIKFVDIPSDYPFNQKQQIQVDAELDGGDVINKNALEEFLSQLEEPVGFLDFETFQQAIPSFDRQRPYQQIPFQYSLHILEDDKLKHFEFLGEPDKDPREALANQLIAKTTGCKTILVYNKTFENWIIRDLANHFPDKAEELKGITDRMVDQMKPFENKDYYTKQMRGKYSIKAVLPALIPELSYSDLGISDGGEAMRSYAKLQQLTDDLEIEKIKSDLLKYCWLDTYAMVKILEKMKSVI